MSNNPNTAISISGKSAIAPVAAGSTAVASFAPTSFDGLVQVAQMMATSGKAVPKHLRANPGSCLAVAMVAYQNGFNPWLLAGDTYEVGETIAYGAKSVTAMVNNSGALERRLHYDLSGAWPNRACTVTGRIKGDDRDKALVVNAATITTRNSPQWKQQPDQQLMYYAARAWSRVYMPEILLGLMGNDEAPDPVQQAEPPAVPRPSRDAPQQHQTAPVVLLPFVTTDGEEISLERGAWIAAMMEAIEAADSTNVLRGLLDSNDAVAQGMIDDEADPDASALHDLIAARLNYLSDREAAQRAAAAQAEGQAQRGKAKTIALWTPTGDIDCANGTEWISALDGWLSSGVDDVADIWVNNLDTLNKLRDSAERREDLRAIALLDAVEAKKPEGV